MAPRYPSNPHRVTLDLDPITSDALTLAAKARTKGDRQRLAYQLVQQGLGIGVSMPPAAAPTDPADDDDMTHAVRRGLAAIDNLNRNKPKGNA